MDMDMEQHLELGAGTDLISKDRFFFFKSKDRTGKSRGPKLEC